MKEEGLHPVVCEEGSVGRPLVSKGLEDVHNGRCFRGQKLVVKVGEADPQGHPSRTEAGSKEPQGDGEDVCWLNAPLSLPLCSIYHTA